MEQIQEWCGNPFVMMVATLIFGMVAGWLSTKLPDLWGPYLVKQIEALFHAGDDADDKLFLAVLVWAEDKLGPMRGEEKYILAVKLLLKKAPLWVRVLIGPKTKQVAKIFEANYERLRLEIKKAAKRQW